MEKKPLKINICTTLSTTRQFKNKTKLLSTHTHINNANQRRTLFLFRIETTRKTI